MSNIESQRLDAYLNLIQSLLNCSVGEEQQLLEANQDLIDSGFLQVLEAVIKQAEQEGAKDAAQFLSQLLTVLQQSISEAISSRLPAYSKLVQTLLTCPQGEENQILEAHRDLVDVGLVDVMAQTAGSLAVLGEMEAANFLVDGARQLAVLLGLVQPQVKSTANFRQQPEVSASSKSPIEPTSTNPKQPRQINFFADRIKNLAGVLGIGKSSLESSATSTQEKLSNLSNTSQTPVVTKDNQIETSAPPELPYLLLRLLQITKDSGGNPQAVYSILESNLSQIESDWSSSLRNWASYTLLTVDGNTAKGIAKDLSNLATLFLRCPFGSLELNLEMAIAGYESAMIILNRSTEPTVWAAIQNNLAIAYSDRIQGEKAENLEQAIASHQSALSVYTRQQFPQDWAMTQNNLALVYRQRIKGDKAENIEKAIASHQFALAVYTRESTPRAWATTQSNLAQTYEQRIQGNLQENIEKAIACYQLALQIYTREAFPEQWTTTQQRLTAACQYRDQQLQSDNLLTSNTVLKIGEQAFTAPEIIPLLAKYGFLPQLACEILVEQAIATISCTPEEEKACLSQFYQVRAFQTTEQKQAWLRQHHLTEEQLQHWVTRPLRLEKYQQARWGKQLHSYFIQRKSQLDQVVYSILRHEEPNLVQELYFRMLEGEQSFAELAKQYSQGPEAEVGGLIGPVELGSLSPFLAQSLSSSPVGQILNPIQVGKYLAIIRVEKHIPAQFDATTQKRLLHELLNIWLEKELQQLNL
ncbi:PpiC-type peptidyl-prolyl cis-trans isomerase [Nostoc sp. NIES-4103]|nr:PpiC-type peptidyl-prolyl cis-trans isomerase [Nostoc sp. NIES-4103]